VTEENIDQLRNRIALSELWHCRTRLQVEVISRGRKRLLQQLLIVATRSALGSETATKLVGSKAVAFSTTY
jgi:hypothetical protein